MTDQTINLLQDVVRNARTGLDAVEQLMDRTQGGEMRALLSRERDRYRAVKDEGERALSRAGGEPEPVGVLDRAAMWAGLRAETLLDRSDAHIAEIMIQGATMGAIEMTKSLNAYDGADPAARGIASRFLVGQSESIERQKHFLTN